MDYIYYIFVFIFGLLWGSFLTVVVWRIDDLKSIFIDRSRCVDCKSEIMWYDLIPLISYGILRGRCRKCKHKISSIYPIIELLTAITFILIYIYAGISLQSVLLALIFSLLIVTLGYDSIHMLIVDQIIWLGIILAIVYQLLNYGDWNNWIYLLQTVGWGALIGIAVPLLVVFIGRGKWMGEGDVSLGLMIGIIVGFPNILVSYIVAFVSGSIYGLLLVAIKRKSIKDPVPFGPFLIIGSLVAFFAGNYLINWYMQLVNF